MAPRRALRESLERLQQELGTAASLPEEKRERLQKLLDQALRNAEGEGGGEGDRSAEEDDDEPNSLSERLREFTTDFEESHPNLTLAIGAVADSLSRLGV